MYQFYTKGMQYNCKSNKYFNTKKHLIDIFVFKLAFCLKIFTRSVNLQNKQQSVRAQKKPKTMLLAALSSVICVLSVKKPYFFFAEILTSS